MQARLHLLTLLGALAFFGGADAYPLLLPITGRTTSSTPASIRATPHDARDNHQGIYLQQQQQQQQLQLHQQQQQHRGINRLNFSLLAQSTSSDSMSPDERKGGQGRLDVDALTKYALAIATQMGLFCGIFSAADFVLSTVGNNGNAAAAAHVPFWMNCVIFWLVALKSRVLNPLNNTRPTTDNLEATTTAATDSSSVETTPPARVMPTWTPPGVIFPIIWILIIGPIRAATTAMVYDVTGSYANIAILSLMLHLSIGDVWNTINNVERRYGASVIGVLAVWLSNAHAAYQYYQVSPQAGSLLCLPLVWLTVASALIVRTWQLNPDSETGEPYPLYPVVGQGTTEFKWFQ